MDLLNIFAFALVTFIAVATPGPDVLLALANGTRFGMRKALAGMVGVLLSDAILVLAVSAGLGALLAASEFWFSVLKYVGVLYLAWLGLTMLLGKTQSQAEELQGDPQLRTSSVTVMLRSMLVAITNPKAYLFFSALLPQFVDSTSPQLQQYVILTLVFSVVEFAIMFGYALIGTQASQVFKGNSRKMVEKTCGIAMLFSAGALALVKRAN